MFQKSDSAHPDRYWEPSGAPSAPDQSAAAPSLIGSSERREARRAEIERDSRVVAEALGDELDHIAEHTDSVPLPASLQWFRHHGNYRGAFPSMADLGDFLRALLSGGPHLDEGACAAAARDLLHGSLRVLAPMWSMTRLSAEATTLLRLGGCVQLALAGSARSPPSPRSRSSRRPPGFFRRDSSHDRRCRSRWQLGALHTRWRSPTRG